MAKKANSKKTTPRKYRRRTKKVDFRTGIFLAILGIIFGIALFKTEMAGVAGVWLQNVLTGTFGTMSYILPFALLISGICILAERSVNTRIMWCYLSLFLCICAFLYAFRDFSIYDVDLTFGDNLSAIYDYKEFWSGGVVGGMFGIPLINVFGFVITIIIYSIWLLATLSMLSQKILYALMDSTGNVSKWMVDKVTPERENEMVDYSRQYENEEVYFNPRRKNKIKDFFKNEPKVEEPEKVTVQDNMPKIEEEFEQMSIDKNEDISNDTKEVIQDVVDIPEFMTEKNKKNVEKENTIEKLELEHTEIKEIQENYKLPDINLLTKSKGKKTDDQKELKLTALKLEKTLKSFGVEAKILSVSKGPTITRYELSPAVGVKVSKIIGLSDDIALNLAVSSIRIAPIEGKSAIGIEVPNKENASVTIREMIESDQFESAKSNLSFAAGKNIAGEVVIGDIAKMPHMLIAGSTGSGKSVCINTLITSILYKARPDQVKFIMIDPKVVELGIYNGIPHLLIPVVTDPRKAAGALQWAVQEMVNRYNLFAEKNVRDLKGYNEAIQREGTEGILPQVVIIIDELSDLMMVAPNDVEDAICRLAQMARAAGMHLVVATQRPSVDVVTGLIKANIPSRIAFAVSSQVDSRTILDMGGAEKLLGKGDMLYYPAGSSKPIRLQGPFVSDKEIEDVTNFVKAQALDNTYNPDILEKIENSNVGGKGNSKGDESDVDPLLTQALDMIVETGVASASGIQRRFKVGYNRAARMIDAAFERGIISGPEGSKPRKVLISKEQWENMKEQGEV